MPESKKYKIVTVGTGTNTVEVYTPNFSNCKYSALYRNADTNTLDRRFELDSIKNYADREEKDFARELANLALDQAVSLSSLGNTNVELMMKYFVGRAKNHLAFVGLQEKELRKKIEAQTDSDDAEYRLKPEFIDQALKYEDWVEEKGVIKKVCYLKRINVKGKDVLFPANLRNRTNMPSK